MSERWTVVDASTVYVELPAVFGKAHELKMPQIFGGQRFQGYVPPEFGPPGKYRVRTIIERDDESEPEAAR